MHGHTMNNCFTWKIHLVKLDKKGHCTKFVAKVIQQIKDRDVAKEPAPKVNQINTIMADSKES